jgi:hypothetical protein
MAKTIKVMGAQVDDKVIMWEQSPDHPNGEAFIAGNGTAVEVAETTRVAALIKSGVLVKVNAGKATEEAASADAPVVEETGKPTKKSKGA